MRRMYITITDYHNIIGLIAMASLKNRVSGAMNQLKMNLHTAKRISQVNIPNNIITMNSRVLLSDSKSGQQTVITLSYPHNVDTTGKKISVFSAFGASLLGASEGDLISWDTVDGHSQMKILKVLYQPEAEGHYHL